MLVAGAGGFAKEILLVILQNNPTEKLVFYDDQNTTAPQLFLKRYPVLRTLEEAREYFMNTDKRFAIGVGNPLHRHQMSDKLLQAGGHLVSVVSPLAIVGAFENSIGSGSSIFTHVVIESSNSIGRGCLIHHAAFISHDTVIGDFSEISPSVQVLGKVQIGHHCSIGTSAVLLPGVHIGNHVTIGAGAVVTRNIPDNSVAIGIPARVIKKSDSVSF